MENPNSIPVEPDGMGYRVQSWIGAWQPFTGQGAAAFADASTIRAVAFHLAMVIASCGTASWTLSQSWIPAVTRAQGRLPESAAGIQAGHFTWPERESIVLGETPQFGVAVNPTGRSSPGQVADIQIEFCPSELRINSLTGYLGIAYPNDWVIGLDRVSGRAAWEAWFWAIGAATITALLVFFASLGWAGATVMALPVWLIGLLANRNLSFPGAWRLGLVCWIPAACLLNLGLWGYSQNWLHLVGLAGCAVGHLLVWMAWVLWSLIERPKRPRQTPKEPKNPFRTNSQ